MGRCRITPENNPKLREVFQILDDNPLIETKDLAEKVGITARTANVWVGFYLENYKKEYYARLYQTTVGDITKISK